MKFTRLAVSIAIASLAMPALAQSTPQYSITDLGAVGPGTNYSQAFGMSSNGNYVTGRMIGDDSVSAVPWPAFIWQSGQGSTAQGYLSGNPYNWSFAVNNSGVSVGLASASEGGSGSMPVMWKNGQATALALPTGYSDGRAFAINNNGIAVGSVGDDVTEQATIFNTVTGKTTLINAISSDGSFMVSAYGVSDNGIVVGLGQSPGSLPDMVMYNMNTGVMTTLPVPAFTGVNGSSATGISPNGQYVVGASGNSSQAVIWSAATGVISVALPSTSSNGQLNAVNNLGWAVGESGGQYATPFLYENGKTYTISSLITNGAGWNFDTTTSADATGIDANGDIVGTAQINGIEHAFLLTPTAAVPEPASYALMLAGLGVVGLIARRRKLPR